MQPFDIEVLVKPGLIIFLITLCIVYILTHSPVFSILAAFIKSGFYICYFGIIFDGEFTALDDWFYYEIGKELYLKGVGFNNLTDSLDLIFGLAGGRHIVYYIYNLVSINLFGMGYYAPVAMNIILTLFIAWCGTQLAYHEFNLGRFWRKVFFVFLLFHPDIFIWSSVFNGKDIFVLFLHILLLLSVSQLFRKQYLKSISFGLPVVLILFFLRFYVPLLFTVALLFSLLSFNKRIKHLHLIFISSLLFASVLMWYGGDALHYAFYVLKENLVNPLFGFIRFLLTPIPLNTEDAYRFLELSALIHWLLIPFTFCGVVVVYRFRTKFSRFFLLYVIVFVGLYSVFDGLQGPRHRVQLDYAWATFQLLGLMSFLNLVFASCHRILTQVNEKHVFQD